MLKLMLLAATSEKRDLYVAFLAIYALKHINGLSLKYVDLIQVVIHRISDFLPSIRLLEECFVTKDPFSPDKEKFLVLGSDCSLCRKRVCVGSVRRLITELPRHVFGTDYRSDNVIQFIN